MESKTMEMKPIITKEPVKFLHNFLKRLMDFNESCKTIDLQAADKVRKMKEEQEEKLSAMEQENDRLVNELTRARQEKERLDDDKLLRMRQEKERLDDELSEMRQEKNRLDNDTLSEMERKKNRFYDELSEISRDKEYIATAANNKQEALREYETKLQNLTKDDEKRRQDIYGKMTDAKFSKNASEVEWLRKEKLFTNKEIKQARDKIWQEYQTKCAEILQSLESQQVQKNKLIAGKNAEINKINIEISEKKASVIKKNDEIARENAERINKINAEISAKEADISKKKDENARENAEKINKINAEISEKKDKLAEAFASFETEAEADRQKEIEVEIEKFKTDFNPDEIRKECAEILANEPNPENYECPKDGNPPKHIHIAELLYDILTLGLDDRDISLLEEHYPDLYKNDQFVVPYVLTFDNNFNYLFEAGLGDTQGRKTLINRACSLAMRLFMMIPPKKVNFTFFDPVTLGETFALFAQLVDLDDNRTTKVINGKIWTLDTDIDERLRVLAGHIANVTQRCLQGKYKSIQEYNYYAKQNAEPYQILMVMDFPGGFKEDALRKLEQIMSVGPKCGVYTIILKSGEQTEKLTRTDSGLTQLISDIEAKMTLFSVDGRKIVLGDADKEFKEEKVSFFINPLLPDESLPTEKPLFPTEETMEKVIMELKNKIKGD
jgi:hypothetical protein